ncbi:T9SS outer membrane translocon Sov/SprA [Saccharicrinis carchari]|uniref:T9SS outer membrane translocon Sov/SprA n=1 Tax=Saccharicrinis carchari TaxID=1168039 RepID=UPI001FE3B9BB|nr:cell surface protein SprA [Saccharicrinis carchari]
MNKVFPYILISAFIVTLFAGSGFLEVRADTNFADPFIIPGNQNIQQQPDSAQLKQGSRFAPIEKQSNNPFLHPEQEKSMELATPQNLQYTTQYDAKTGKVHLYRKIGNLNVKLPYTMTLEEYNDEQTRNSMISYWESRARLAEENDKFNIFNPNINIGAGELGNIFGSNLINIKPQGMAELKIGVTRNKIDNPTLQENLRKTTTFDFQEKIQMNIQGNIGDKLKLGINYNTEATFEFENEMKLEYEGKEDDIIQSIEAGNVSLPLPGTLITGSQSLFGVKTEMQFGKLSVTSVFSQQKGETSVMDIQGGAQQQEYELPINEYDKNRHFFLSNYFRDLYNDAQSNYPLLSKISVTRIEVWITNRAGQFDEARNILALMDLGETGSRNLRNTTEWGTSPYAPPANDANGVYSKLNNTYSSVRDINRVTQDFSGTQLINGRDYEKIENARLLSPSEYTLNSRLGFISLNMSLNADEVLAVAYEYDYNGQTYQVGEFAGDGIESTQTLFLKMLKSTNLTPTVKQTWDLMMKNIYAIGAYQVNREDFVFDVVYVDDSTGALINYLPDEGNLEGKLLLSLMELDKLNEAYDPIPDGTFDYIENQTIYPQNGRVIFPVLEPFGSHLLQLFGGDENDPRWKKYGYQALYDSTQTLATQNAEKNKFRLKGQYKSSTGSEISLNAQNIPQGSVIVTAGGIKLVENVDYTVDYSFGTVKIINQGLLGSGSPIQVSLESQSLFNLQTKTLMGTHLNYQFNKDFNFGGTIMHLRERPLTQKVSIGDEPIANTIYGFNTSYFTESQVITNLLNNIPLLQVKEPSSISFEGEFAQLIPGHPDVIKNEGEAYIDDFEGTKISIDMRNWTAWNLASTPQGQTDLFPNAHLINDLSAGFERAKAAWYIIDPLFSRDNQYTPSHVRNDLDLQSNHFSREVFIKEIFPNQDVATGTPTNIPVLNFAYYPKERGPYNFTTDLDINGNLINPETRWGGIQRRVETSDFEAANIEFIEFWMMDPFVYDENPEKAGDLYFNLGNISEDVLSDSRKFFEQGMPGPGEPFDVDSTAWGLIPTKQSLVSAFSNDPDARLRQDVGLNGLNSEQERTFYKEFIEGIETLRAAGALSEAAYNGIMNDPAADDYHYFRGSDFDRDKVSILDRYKNFNGPEGNSVPSEYSPESYATASISTPNMEDINRDNTLSENESYYQYKVSLDPNNMEVGTNYITDVREAEVELKNKKTERVKWYQFRIPISLPDTTIGNIQDMRSIRFMRMFMHNFRDTTILRFATLDLVRSEWRKYTNDLSENETILGDEETQFETGAVNIEENANRSPINYVLPPGIDRIIDPANPQLRELNEQSISLKVSDMPKNSRRAVFKTMNMDMRQYGRLKMEVHAEEFVEGSIGNNNVRAFIRLGSDSRNNYYEYEIPLEMTPHGATSARDIWPVNNRFDFAFSALQGVKLKRNQNGAPVNEVYTAKDDENNRNWVKIKGNPNLSNVRNIMIGVRSVAEGKVVTFETWFNELRLTDFNEEGGWAANARMNIKLSDLGNVSLAGNTHTVGFGSIEKNVMERSQEDFYQYDIATNLELGKFTGAKSRLSIPFYFGYSKEVASPDYYPLDPDIPLDVALDNAGSSAQRDSIKKMSQDVVKRKSVNFTNVRLMPKSNQSKIYDVANLSATYSYNITTARNVNTEERVAKDYRGVLAYNFNNRPKVYEPFKKSKALNGEAFKLIKDFNFYLMPTQLSYRNEMLRQYNQEQLRNVNNPNFSIPITVRKDFNWNRYFDLRYNLTKQLKFDFKSVTNARIDEPLSVLVVDKNLKDDYTVWKDSVMSNIMNGGRVTNYQHNFNASYKVPIDKLPYLDWTNTTVRYSGMYRWQTAPQSTNESIEWGNTISNSNNIQGSVQLNLKSLYNRSGYLKGLSRKYGGRNPRSRSSNKQTVRYNKEGIDLKKGQSYIINHKLRSNDAKARMYDANGRTARGESITIDQNKIEFIPAVDYENARVMVTGTREDQSTILGTIADYTAMLATGVKSISVNYTETNGTILPGYLPESKFLGSSTYNGFNAPGYGFIAGWQDRDFARKAAERGWVTVDTINQAYVMTHQEDFTIKSTIEPIDGLRIDLTANRRYSNNMNEYYYKQGDSFQAYNMRENGNFTMTFNLINTAFEKVSKTGIYESKTYNEFLQNRQILASKLARKRVGLVDPATNELYDPLPKDGKAGGNGYGLNSQEVLIPAFLAAYSGKDANNIFTDLFPTILKMHPNWRVTYNGLTKIKPVKKLIKTFEITHGYRSTYSVGSFVSNSDYNSNSGDGISWIRNLQDNFISEHQVNSVSLNEMFMPLIGFNITWVNNLTTKIENKRTRTINLSLSNNQIIENHNNDLTIGVGYRFDKMDLILGSKAGAKKMSSDLNLRVDFSMKDNIAIFRRIEDGVNQLTSGRKINTLKVTADYVLSDRFNMQVFYDRAVTSPYISSSYPTSNSNFGVSFRFSLTQ